MKRHALTDEQWDLVEPLIPQSKAAAGRPARDRRLMLDAALWVLATGAPWRDLPERFGPWQSAYHRFNIWRKDGVFARIIEALQVRLDKDGLIDWDLWCVDGASVRASRAAAGASKEVSKPTGTSPKTTRWAAAEAAPGMGIEVPRGHRRSRNSARDRSDGGAGPRIHAAGIRGGHVHREPQEKTPPQARTTRGRQGVQRGAGPGLADRSRDRAGDPAQEQRESAS